MVDSRESLLGRELPKLIESNFPDLCEVRDSLAALAREEALTRISHDRINKNG